MKTDEKIDSITKEQEALLADYREEGIRVGLDTSRMDKKVVEDLINRVYREILKKEPVPVYFEKGPISGYAKAKELGYTQSLTSFHSHSMSGSFDTNWAYSFKYYKDVLGVKNIEVTNLMVEVCQNMGQWAPFETCCIVMEKPTIIKKDDEGLLHCEDGPAIAYEDGFEVYGWHGQRIPREWIMQKESLDPSIALTWPQIEQRRAAAEIIGWHNVLAQLPTKVIDKDSDPQIGELLEVDIPEIGKEWFLRVLCGTGREFAIPVPRNAGFKTALGANAWTYGMDEDNFMPEVRT